MNLEQHMRLERYVVILLLLLSIALILFHRIWLAFFNQSMNCKNKRQNPTFRSSHDSIIKENMNKVMQITAFEPILARRINIRGSEDYKNSFARIESDCTLRFGFKAVIKSISYTKQSNLFLHFLSTLKCFSRP